MRRSAGFEILPDAFAIAETVLPPSRTRGGSVGLPTLPAESGRWMIVLKNCCADPRSYLMPRASRSVRFTSTILALMFTCGWRRSSDAANATRSSTTLSGAVMLTLFVTSSALTLPRPRQVDASEDELEAVGVVGVVGGVVWPTFNA